MTKKKATKKKAAGKTPTKKKAASKQPAAKKTTGKKTAGKKKTTARAASTTKTQPRAKTAADKKARPAKAQAAKSKKPKAAVRGKSRSKTAASGKQQKEPTTGVTVQIGPSKPAITVAPGAMLSKAKKTDKKTESAPEAPVRKLTKRERDNIREQLLAKRKQLLHGIQRELEDHRQRGNTTPADDADKASDAYDESLSFEIASANDEELGKIRDALDKIEEGTYGICESCGCNIPPSRLKILPYATHCKGCRAAKERARMRGDTVLNWGLVADVEDEDNN